MADLRKRAYQLRDSFQKADAVVVEPPVLQPAETLLDLYGEDIRARAYVTSDALRGEQMLRPDFTVPVVEMHMANGAEPARYTYAGEVFRRQEDNPERPSEYLQVGYEIFDRQNPAAADAEVFALVASALAHLNVQPVTGDIGILMSAINGLDTTQARKAALLRHVWRPRRFRALLDRFAAHSPVPQTRAALLGQDDPVAMVPEEVAGKRSRAEIIARIKALQEDASTPPISADQVALLNELLAVRDHLPRALQQLQELAMRLPSIQSAVDRLQARRESLQARGVAVETLSFEASYGRTSMEYYDGFVFGFYSVDRQDLPAIASGGRYDALTRRLGRGAEIPAVGAVLRPGLMFELEAGDGA